MRLLPAVALAALIAPSVRAADPDFNRDVRPILAGKCFKCHGPDDKARKGDLRLDLRDDAVKAGAIAPGKPDKSELVRRTHSADAAEVMPPAAVKNPLTDREKQTLQAWVAAGASYEPHWAFVPPKRPPIPVSRESKTSANPIDDFVGAKRQAAGLAPSPPADRYTLIRRVSLDLTGLPPTPDEADAFVKDESPNAYEKLVDRLLASPHYGERWARHWLDLARYADTNGYEKDRPRSVWPYRDWVIRAFNDDLPFDQFTVAQLAGDLLPNATAADRVATGFHRNTMLNEEGGIDPLEFRYYAVVDRANATATTWLGLTMGCAQCHTHKFDPVTHAEYFRFLAFLNNAEEPDLELPTAEQTKQRSATRETIRTMEAELPGRLPVEQREKLFDVWLAAQRKDAVKWTTLRPKAMDAGPDTKLTLLADGSVLAGGDPRKQDVYALTLADLPPGTTALRIEALPHDSLPNGGPGRAFYEGPKGDFLLGEFALSADGKPVKFAGATESFKSAPNTTAALALDGQSQTGWAGRRDGQGSNAVFPLAAPLSAKSAKLELVFERHYSASLGRFRISATTDKRAVTARDIPGEVEDLLLLADGKLTAGQRAALLHHWAATAPELKAARDEIDAVRKQLPNPPTTLVLRERPADFPRPTFRHHRGEFLQPKERVEPGVPGFLPPLPKGADANRLALARWLVSPENPLTARVAVNREWQAFFGRGLVRTLDDFGYQGDPPTHPELLDWLALEFMSPSVASGGRESPVGDEKNSEQKKQGADAPRSPWSLKRLHKLIVMSATYRQSSRVTPELLATDPENTLLARGPRVRLEAELVRDSLLTAGGLLARKLGGPSVFPPQPTVEGSYGGGPWKVSDGEDRYRRGLYTFSKRTAPYAMFGTFDGPSGESCIARRDVSNTPLQALTLLNDPVATEAAQHVAKRVAEHPGKAEERATFLFRLCLTRPPKADELAALVKFYTAKRATFATDPERADAVAGAGPGAAERAAWTAVARVVLNLDEFVTKE